MSDQVTAYQRSVLLALAEGAASENDIIGYLQMAGWSGYDLVPERIEATLKELRDRGFVEEEREGLHDD